MAKTENKDWFFSNDFSQIAILLGPHVKVLRAILMHIPYLWSKTRKNAASSMQLFVGQSFQVNSQFSFFRKANHQWLCLWAMLDDTRSPIGYGLLPPLGQSLSETESFVDTSTSVSQYPFKLHWFSSYLRIRIIYCKFLAQNNCNCAIFTIFNKNPVFLHTITMSSEFPSNINTMTAACVRNFWWLYFEI